MKDPSEKSLSKIRKYVLSYWEKTGTSGTAEAEEVVVKGLALHLDELGKPLCPCIFYPDKKRELEEHGRRWVCPCDEMRQYKYCHCLLFTRPDGLPITEYLPDGHEGKVTYGITADPTPERGRDTVKEA